MLRKSFPNKKVAYTRRHNLSLEDTPFTILISSLFFVLTHNASVYVKADQHAHDAVWHVIHHVKALCMMCLTIAVDDNAERDGVND